MIYDIFFGCNWVDTLWQEYSTHLHKNNAQNNTMKQNTQDIHKKEYINIKIKVHNL